MAANFSIVGGAFGAVAAPWALGPHGAWLLLCWAYAFVVGSCLGSFVGVVVARLPQQQSIVRPRSRCDGCQRPLGVRELVPVLSYLWQRGRCRQCHAPIGVRALWLELACGGVSMALAMRLEAFWPWAFCTVFVALLLGIALLDIDHWWVPDVLSGSAAAVALLAAVAPGGLGLRRAAAGVLPSVGVWALAAGYAKLTGREGMGLGDIKILGACGLLLGAGASWAMILLASVQGALVGSVVLLLGGHAPTDGPPPPALADDPWQPPPHAVPFGPFLALAAIEILLWPPIWPLADGRVWGVYRTLFSF